MSNASQSESVTLRVPSEVIADIEAIAKATDRSRSYIIVRALRTYLMNEGFDILAAIKDREQIATGQFENMDDVIADIERIVGGKAA